MELKVWVDGIQRVVCGITDQTTVQEVVIALAQATGRTGRYTLVEQRNSTERMLPPSERPLQVLSKMGDRSNEIQFVLRRTGASSVSGQDAVVTPERTAYRQSLPPHLKHKQKSEVILNRKEPKRKSLTISGFAGDSSNKSSADKVVEKPYSGKLPENSPGKHLNPKKALIPPPMRTISDLSQASPGQTDKTASPLKAKKDLIIPAAFRQDEPSGNAKKKALLPPPLRGDPEKVTGNESPIKSQSAARFRSKTPDRLQHRHAMGPSSSSANVKPRPDSAMAATSDSGKAPTNPMKARSDFARLVVEQHNHIKEQTQTLQTIGEEMEKYEQTIGQHEKNAASIQEIESLEAKIRENETDLYNDKLLEELLDQEEREGSQLQNETSKLQSEIASIDSNVKDLEKHLSFLSEEITKESRRRKYEEDNAAILRRETLAEIERQKMKMNQLSDEITLLQRGLDKANEESQEKKTQLEHLNRELRQVNLQQFIRQTGSKVTVLPPVAEKGHGVLLDESNPTPYYAQDYDQTYDQPTAPYTGNTAEAGGVWV